MISSFDMVLKKLKNLRIKIKKSNRGGVFWGCFVWRMESYWYMLAEDL